MRHAPHRFHSLPASSASHLLLYVLLYVALAATIAVSAGCGSGGEVQLPCGPPMCELLASDGAEGDFFGDAVSISGDVSIVGAPGDRDNGTDSGSAYVYRFNGFEWYEEAKLVPSDGAAGDFFGTSVAVDGAVAVVGAFGDNEQGLYTGAAYVFRYDGAQWLQEQKLEASDAAEEDLFGFSVSIDGDVIVVGAYVDDDTVFSSGSAYVWEFDGADWVEKQKLHASDPANKAYFGTSVAISGDVIAVGAGNLADADDQSGAVYVFEYDGADWIETQKLKTSDAAMNDFFGSAVAVSGDTIVAGATGDDDDGRRSGSAYVFSFDGLDWVEEAKLTASDAAERDFFGSSVAIDGGTIVVGAQSGNDEDGVESGSAYVFGFDGFDWIEEEELLAPTANPDEQFGNAVSISGGRILVGARYRDGVAATPNGSAFVFE